MSKIIAIVGVLLIVFTSSCNKKLDQNSMFHGRGHKVKKSGIYDAGINGRKTVSMQIAEGYDKQTKHDANPKKAVKKINKELEKRQRKAQKKRDKHNRKVRVKIKKGKGSKSPGDS